jgi:hypothetical protein
MLQAGTTREAPAQAELRPTCAGASYSTAYAIKLALMGAWPSLRGKNISIFFTILKEYCYPDPSCIYSDLAAEGLIKISGSRNLFAKNEQVVVEGGL